MSKSIKVVGKNGDNLIILEEGNQTYLMNIANQKIQKINIQSYIKFSPYTINYNPKGKELESIIEKYNTIKGSKGGNT